MFGIGPLELMIVAVMGLMIVGGAGAIFAVVFLGNRRNAPPTGQLQDLVSELEEENRLLRAEVNRLRASGITPPKS